MIKNKIIWLLVVFVVFLIGFLVFIKKDDYWYKFSTDGEIYSGTSFTKNKVFFGNNMGQAFSVDLKIGDDVWVRDLNKEVVGKPVVDGKNVIFTSSDGILYALNVKSGEEVWRLKSNGSSVFVAGPWISNGTLFVGDTRGNLYAINPLNGEVKWNYHAEEIKSVSDVLVAGRPNWFGSFTIYNKVVYWGASDGFLYALNIKNGKLLWKYNIVSASSTQPVVLGNKLYVGTKEGLVFVLNRKSGDIINKLIIGEKSIKCLDVIKQNNLFEADSVLTTLEDGTIKLSKETPVWETKLDENGVSCPVRFRQNLYVTDISGILRAINVKNGKEFWNLKLDYPMTSGISVATDLVDVDAFSKSVIFNTSILYFGDEGGNLYAVKGKSGGVIWKFKAFAKINGNPSVVKKYIYFTSSDGALYRLNKLNGKPSIKFSFLNKPKISTSFNKFLNNNVYEMTVSYNEEGLQNPFSEVNLTAELVHESGKKVYIDGFYYDKNTWKLRFNPPKKGKWEWNLVFDTPVKDFNDSGQFVSETDTSETYLKISSKNPKILTLDDKTIFNGFGIQTVTQDKNRNGDPFDDWTFGDSDQIGVVFNGVKSYYKGGEVVETNKYLSVYRDEGGFNLFRWGFGNKSFQIWEGAGVDVDSPYLITEGKNLDTFFEEVKNNDYRLWVSLFNFNVPLTNGGSTIERAAVGSYLKYVIARYGVYVDIWELANEAHLENESARFLANKINEYDFENRPITLSWDNLWVNEIDIISPHWYETEELPVSDLKVADIAKKYKEFAKPIVVGEQADSTGWSEQSAIRMRVRSWTAFFNHIILIFWNYTADVNYCSNGLADVNVYSYVGKTERKLMKVLKDFSSGVDISAKQITFKTDRGGVRAYGLSSESQILGYLFHFGGPTKPVEVAVNVDVPKNGKIIWFSTHDGSVLKQEEVNRGSKVLISPTFTADISFKVIYD